MSSTGCVFVRPGRMDSFPELVFKKVPDCKHILIVTKQEDILTRSFCNDVFGNDKYTFRSVFDNDPEMFAKITAFTKTFPQNSIILFYSD